jgi:hypothetical protein
MMHITPKSLATALFALLLLACERQASETATKAPDASPTVSPHWSVLYTVGDSSARLPNIHWTGDMQYLTWVEQEGKTSHLRQAELNSDGANSVKSIRSGEDWMLHWADLPGAGGTPLNRYAWHQIHNPADAHASDIRLYRAIGNGWDGPIAVHAPTPVGEHAFVSGCAMLDGQFGMAWLQPSADTSHGGATELAFRTFNMGKGGETRVLDARVCDCCPTAMASTDSTVIVAYRDRSDAEIRDVHYQLWDNGNWSGPLPLGAEGWRLEGCPVNGPTVAASGEHALIAWWTQHSGQGTVHFATSSDYGRHFELAQEFQSGVANGQVSAAMQIDGSALITWLAPMDSAKQAILAYYHPMGHLDTVAIFPETQQLVRPIVGLGEAVGFTVVWKGPGGIVVAGGGRN